MPMQGQSTTPDVGVPAEEEPMCQHQPSCPSAEARDREAAQSVASHPDQGWSLLCNGVVVFDDTGELLPDGRTVAPHRPDYLLLQHAA